MQLSEILSTLDRLLEPERFRDLGPNGLQVPPARTEVSKVVTGVSAQRELIERAVERGAQLVLVHHGLLWDFKPTGLTPVLAERLRPLFVHDVALAAYHLPLDAHPEVGNRDGRPARYARRSARRAGAGRPPGSPPLIPLRTPGGAGGGPGQGRELRTRRRRRR